jgi:Zn finger protein HypA/HybF involved in hydrogenase expression
MFLVIFIGKQNIMDREKLRKMTDEGLSIRKISVVTKTSYTSVRYWLNKYELKTNGYDKKYKWDEDSLRESVKHSECKSDVLRLLNISTKSGNFQTLDKYLKKYGIDSDGLIYNYKRGNKWVPTKTEDEVFCENSSVSKPTLKRRLQKSNLIEYKCQKCGLEDEWNGKKIQLQLDHINGKNDDNRIENLRYLCPNCHSQTATYCMGTKKR